MFDILIRGGKVIDPSQGLSGYRDVAVKGGKIAALLDPGAGGEAGVTIDATGHLVTPGLIDLHVHVYPHVPLGLDADQLCSSGGVTTMLDTGSAGCNNFDAFPPRFHRQGLSARCSPWSTCRAPAWSLPSWAS